MLRGKALPRYHRLGHVQNVQTHKSRWPLVTGLEGRVELCQRLDLVIMGVFSNLNNSMINQGLGLNPRGGGTGRQKINPWMCYLVALPAGAVLPPWLVWSQCRARATAVQQPLPADVLPLHGGWKHSQERRWQEGLPPAQRLPSVPSAQPGAALASPSIRWWQNLQS